MRKLAWIVFALASSRSECNAGPPAQAPEAAVKVPGESATSAASADADIVTTAGEAPPPAPPPTDAFQPVTATLGGATWELKGAGTLGPVQADGTVVVVLANYNVECGAHAPAAGDKTITITMPWEKGAKFDVATLKAKAIVAAAFDEKKKKLQPFAAKDWKPSGIVEVLAAPTKGKSSGRLRLDLANKLDIIKAEVPVRFCFPG